MPDVVTKDLGPVSAYAIAVANGYQGTEAQWIAELAATSANARTAATKAGEAAGSAQAAAGSAQTAEGAAADAQKWTTGAGTSGEGGGAVPGTKNNAAYWAGKASDSAGSAEGSAEDAQKWTTGAGTSGDGGGTTPGTKNNAAYWAGQASDSAGVAAGHAANAQAWTTGGSGGTPSATNNAEYWAGEAADSAAAVDSEIEDALEVVRASNVTASKKMFMEFESGGVNPSNGNSTSNAARCRSTFFNLIKGAVYTVKTGYEFVLFEYDFTGTSSSFVGSRMDEYVTSYLATDNATVVMVQKLASGDNITDVTDACAYIADPNDPLRDELTLEAVSQIMDTTMTTGKVLTGDSAGVSSSTAYETTGYIPVNPGDTLIVSATWGGTKKANNYTGLYGYDASHTLVGCIASSYILAGWNAVSTQLGNAPAYVADKVVVTVPSGVYYVRTSSRYKNYINSQAPKVIKVGTVVKEADLTAAVGTVVSVADFEQGTLSEGGEEPSGTAENRIRTDYISLPGDSTVLVKLNGQKAAFLLFLQDGTFLENSGWKYNDIVIREPGKKIRFVVAETDDADLAPSDLDAEITIYSGMENRTMEADALTYGISAAMHGTTLKTIAHRGYNSVAPENTISAFRKARKMGYRTIETDIQLTSDGVPVILHDKNVSRTSNGTGNIYDMTLDQAKALDFGSWKSPEYTGERIPTFEEMLLCCKKIGLNVYIEIKSDSPWTQENMAQCVRTVRRCGMRDHVAWISFGATLLGYVRAADPKARLGFIETNFTTTSVDTCVSLRTGENEVFAVAPYYNVSAAEVEYLIDNDVPLAVYNIDTVTDAESFPAYASEVLTNEWNVGAYLYRQNIG